MAYSINPYLPSARKQAILLVVKERQPISIVARKFGVSRSTIYRWLWRWQEVNPYRDTNWRKKLGQLQYYKFTIPTKSSKPHTSPKSLPYEIVKRVIELRRQLKRCAEVIWYYLVHEDGIRISLSSVRRILKRNCCLGKTRKKRVKKDNPRRPHVTKPGELVETDTIHYVRVGTKRRVYVYTVIDVFSRMAYAEVHSRILPGLAAQVVLHARNEFGFNFCMVQSDNGLEFSSYFEQVLKSQGVIIRHTRLGRPNDNAHIERFNRTIQEECLGRYISESTPITHLQGKIENYLEYYNYKRVHLGLQCKTPARYMAEVLRRC